MTTRRVGRSGRLEDETARFRQEVRGAELVERIAEKVEHGPSGPRTRADERRAAHFAKQRAAEHPDADAEAPTAAGEGERRDSTVVAISRTRRTRVRRGTGKSDNP